MRTAIVVTCLVSSWRLAVAQEPSPYVPAGWWGTVYVEHLIARGRLSDPAPLTRPLRQADVLAALRAADSASLSAGEWTVVKHMRADLERRERGAYGRLDGTVGIAARSYARRDPLRAAGGGPGHGDVSGGLDLQLTFGAVTVVTHPYFDTRLKWDPDYAGKKDRAIAGRNAEAYVSAEWRYGDVFFGAVDRNWGPPALEGLLVSPSPYSYDHFAVGIGTRGVRLEGLITQLDDMPDTSGTPNHRYFIAHRLVLRPPGHTTVALWEGSVLAGPDRQLEPWFANIFTLGLLTQYDQQTSVNSLLGVDVITRIGRTNLFGSLLIDDIQVDRSVASDKEPAQYGFTLGGQGGIGPAGWTLFYTRVANLTYRTNDPPEAVMRRGVGLARNFSDYDQLTLRGSVVAAHGALLTPEVTLLRQGQGDFRLPYPPVSAYDTTPTFLDGVVERTVRLALSAQWSAGAWTVAGDGGVHLIHNAGHATGVNATQWVGSVSLSWRFRRESVLP